MGQNAGAPGAPEALLLRSVRTMVRVRWLGVVFALAQVFTYYTGYPAHAKAAALAATGLLAAGNAAIWLGLRRGARSASLALCGLALDVAVVLAFVFVYSFDQQTAIWALMYILPLEGAICFQLRGAVLTMSAVTAGYVAREIYGHAHFGYPLTPTSISFRSGIGFIIAIVAGSMASSLVRDRIAAERHADALALSEERFRRVFEAGPVGLVLFDPQCHIMSANDAFAAIAGRDAAELPGVALDEVLEAGGDAAGLFGARDGSYTVQQRIQGSNSWVQVSASAIRDRDGTPLYGLALVEDVTARVREREALSSALERETRAGEHLRQADDFKTALLAAVSHDLRTPLAIIYGFARTLEDRMDRLAKEAVAEIVTRMRVNADRLDRLLVNLLDMDRITRGSVVPKVLAFDVASLVNRSMAEIDHGGHPVHIKANHAIVHADAELTERIFENLVTNAVRYTPPGAPIDVVTERTPDGIFITVEDRGSGIPDGAKQQIFEPFHRLQATGGTGIGLSLVRAFAEIQGGRVWVEDRPGGGASFHVFVPSREQDAAAAG